MLRDKTQKNLKEEKTRQRIIAYAQRVFFDRGFRRVTIEELCFGMALSKRTFYKYYKNRDELVMGVFAHIGANSMVKVVENLLSDRPVPEVLERHFQLLSQEVFGNISVTFMADIQTLMPDLWQMVDNSRNQILQLLVKVIDRGKREGAVRAEIDPEILGKLLQRIVGSIADPAFLIANGINMADIPPTIKKIVLHGILVTPATKESGDVR